MSIPSLHGVLRGSDNVSRSQNTEGLFGRMFRSLPGAEFGNTEDENIDALTRLAKLMISLGEVPKDGNDPEESRIPAGYTYLGQFIAHDLTFDPISSLARANDPEALIDYRTPRFDLDCIYGRGPADQPYLYRDDGVRLLLGDLLDNKKDWDVPRNTSTFQDSRRTGENSSERAIIADPRNDENVIISQLHALFLRFHNRMADQMKGTEKGNDPDFAAVQQAVRWHYQWVILHEFLPGVINGKTYEEFLPCIELRSQADVLRNPPLHFYKPKEDPYLPIEFSAAAYRFGHSTVRPSYELNRLPGGPFPIFGGNGPLGNLSGFVSFNRTWAIDWDLFFGEIPDAPPPVSKKDRVQPAYKIDTSLADPLGNLPPSITKDRRPSLAQRNLIRGWRLGLPSGQAVARAMGIEPIADPKVKIVKADSTIELVSLTDPRFEGALDVFKDNAPLWFYVLAEAQEEQQGEKLGPVGSRIVMETFVGLMLGDSHSYLRQDPLWTPDAVAKGGKFGMAEFIKIATAA